MRYTIEQQSIAIQRAAKRLNIDPHVSNLQYKREFQTWADRIIGVFFFQGMPVKRSYMMCNSLDMTFFFTPTGGAIYTYAGYADERDANEKIIEAFSKANLMRRYMEEEISKLEQEVSDAERN